MAHYKCGYRATDTDTITKETAESTREREIERGGRGGARRACCGRQLYIKMDN